MHGVQRLRRSLPYKCVRGDGKRRAGGFKGLWWLCTKHGLAISMFMVVAWITQLDPFNNMEKRRDPIRWIGPVLAGDRLVLVGTNSTLVTLDPVSGAVRDKQELSDAGSVSPVVAGGTTYVITDDATLSALR